MAAPRFPSSPPSKNESRQSEPVLLLHGEQAVAFCLGAQNDRLDGESAMGLLAHNPGREEEPNPQ
jgi:hypothetical protein